MLFGDEFALTELVIKFYLALGASPAEAAEQSKIDWWWGFGWLDNLLEGGVDVLPTPLYSSLLMVVAEDNTHCRRQWICYHCDLTVAGAILAWKLSRTTHCGTPFRESTLTAPCPVLLWLRSLPPIPFWRPLNWASSWKLWPTQNPSFVKITWYLSTLSCSIIEND